MAQHDYVIDNQASAAARADLNSLFQAIASQNSGATAPTTTYANMIWYDTANDLLKMRNEANSGWITVGTLDQALNTFTAPSVNGKTVGTLTAAGGIAYATSSTALAAIGAGTAGQALLSGGAGAPTWGEATPFFPRIKLIAIQSSTTYTIASGKRACIIAVGAGGGGAAYKYGSVNDNRTIFGGNGGSAVRLVVTPSSNLTLTITVGAGGAYGTTSSGGASGSAGSATTVTGTGVNISAAGGAGGIVISGTGSTLSNASSSGGTVFDIEATTTTGATDRRSTAGGVPFGGGGGTIGGTTYNSNGMFTYFSSNTRVSRAVSPNRYDKYPSEMLYARELLIGALLDDGILADTYDFMDIESGGLGNQGTSGTFYGGSGGIGCGGGGGAGGGTGGTTQRGGTGGVGYVIILEEA